LEVAGEKLPGVLRVAALGRGCETDEVGKQHRDVLALRRRGNARRRRRLPRQRGSAFPAELDSRRVRAAAGRAGLRERAPALAAELPTGLILTPAGRATHQ